MSWVGAGRVDHVVVDEAEGAVVLAARAVDDAEDRQQPAGARRLLEDVFEKAAPRRAPLGRNGCGRGTPSAGGGRARPRCLHDLLLRLVELAPVHVDAGAIVGR